MCTWSKRSDLGNSAGVRWLCLDTFERWHLVHSFAHFVMSLFIETHTYLLRICLRVALVPGCARLWMELKSWRRKIFGIYGRNVDVEISQIILIFWSSLSSKADELYLKRFCSSESEFCACWISSRVMTGGMEISFMRDKESATMLSRPIRWTISVEYSAMNERWRSVWAKLCLLFGENNIPAACGQFGWRIRAHPKYV